MQQPKSFEELVALLKKHRVPYNIWKNGPKDVQDLWQEFLDGEVRFKRKRIEGKMRLVRVAARAQIEIFIVMHRRLKKLFEGPQKYSNGSKPRYRSSERSLSEKIRQFLDIPETAEEAALRGLAEELGIHTLDPDLLWVCKRVVEDYQRSKTYPGLYNKYTNFRFRLMLPHEFYQETYTENVQGRKTLFRWKLF